MCFDEGIFINRKDSRPLYSQDLFPALWFAGLYC